MSEARYIFGLDLGQQSDPSALVVVERVPIQDGRGKVAEDYRGPIAEFHVRHIERYPLWTPFPEIVAAVQARHRQLRDPSVLVGIDATGCGRSVVDLFLTSDLPKATLRPITVTGGFQSRRGTWCDSDFVAYWVPKSDVVGAIQAALGTGRIKIVAGLPLADTLKAEMLNFKVRTTPSGNEQFGEWRINAHDDLCFALGLAVWVAAEESAHAGPVIPCGPAVTIPRKLNVLRRRYGTRDSSEDTWNRRGDARDGTRRYGPSYEGGW